MLKRQICVTRPQRVKVHSNIIFPSTRRADKCDFGLPPPCNSDIHSSWTLRNVDWLLVTDVAEPVGCPETSVTNNQSVLRNIPKEPNSHVKSDFIPTFVEKSSMHFPSYWLLMLSRQVEILYFIMLRQICRSPQQQDTKRGRIRTTPLVLNLGARCNWLVNPLNPELSPICYLLALLAHHFLHVSRIMVKSLTLRLLMSYIYIYIYIYIYMWIAYSWCF